MQAIASESQARGMDCVRGDGDPRMVRDRLRASSSNRAGIAFCGATLALGGYAAVAGVLLAWYYAVTMLLAYREAKAD